MTQPILLIVPAIVLAWAWMRARQRISMVLMWRSRAIADELFWLGQETPELRGDGAYQLLLLQARVGGISLAEANLWNVLRPGALKAARRVTSAGMPLGAWQAELEKRPQLLAYDRRIGRLSTFALMVRHLWLVPLYVGLFTLVYLIAGPILALLLVLSLGLDGLLELVRLMRTARSSRAFAALVSAMR